MSRFYRNYTNFKGRSSREDFWLPILSFCGLSMLSAFFSLIIYQSNLTVVIHDNGLGTVASQSTSNPVVTIIAIVMTLVWIVISFLSIIPIVSCTIRRYRDVGLNNRGIIWLMVLSLLFSSISAIVQSHLFAMIMSVMCGVVSFILLVLPGDYLIGRSRAFTRYFYRV